MANQSSHQNRCLFDVARDQIRRMTAKVDNTIMTIQNTVSFGPRDWSGDAAMVAFNLRYEGLFDARGLKGAQPTSLKNWSRVLQLKRYVRYFHIHPINGARLRRRVTFERPRNTVMDFVPVKCTEHGAEHQTGYSGLAALFKRRAQHEQTFFPGFDRFDRWRSILLSCGQLDSIMLSMTFRCYRSLLIMIQ